MSETIIIPTNEFQTKITKELLDQYPAEVQCDNDYTVYRHIAPNGKVYIGITSLPLFLRWKVQGVGYKKCKLFYRAIKKYGWDNFIHDVILDGVSKSEAIYTERYLIRWYKSLGISYNITDGGESNTGIVFSEESRKKISEKLKEVRCRPVLQYSIDGRFIKEYKSAKEASKMLGYGHTSVSNCASGRRGKNILHGFIFIYKDDIKTLDKRLEQCSCSWRKYKIVQYKDGAQINTFDSIRDAGRATGINRICIERNINGKYKMAGGFTWAKEINV